VVWKTVGVGEGDDGDEKMRKDWTLRQTTAGLVRGVEDRDGEMRSRPCVELMKGGEPLVVWHGLERSSEIAAESRSWPWMLCL
jgi:hypothetical protein